MVNPKIEVDNALQAHDAEAAVYVHTSAESSMIWQAKQMEGKHW